MLQRLSLIEACLRTKQVQRAQALFDSISHEQIAKPQLQQIVNMFIQQNVDLKQSLHWYSKCKQLQLIPDQQSQQHLLNVSKGTPFQNILQKQISGLSYLQQNLEPLALSLHDNEQALIEQQIKVEQESVRIILEQIQTNKYASLSKQVQTMTSHWHTKLILEIKKKILEVQAQVTHEDNEDIGPYLLFFEKFPELLSAATVSTFVKCFSGKDQYNSSNLVFAVGECVYQEYKLKTTSKQKIISDYLRKQPLTTPEWPVEVKYKIGAMLSSVLLDVATLLIEYNDKVESVFQHQPAFSHGYIYDKGKQIGVINAHEKLQEMLTEKNAAVIPKLLPMIVPPKSWVDYKSGGYLTIRTNVMRAMNKESLRCMQEATMTGAMDKIFGALDALGQTKWRINEDLLKHVLFAWQNELPVAKLPAKFPEKVNVEKAEDFDSNSYARYQYYQKTQAIRQESYEFKGTRASENYKIEIAKALVGKTLYFPHNLDFRGRAYPIPQLFNHIGNDLSRSLLVFEEKKPLGRDGFKWLQVHIANCYGHDKVTFEERVYFVKQNEDKILASAEDPFKNDWWLTADKPWLTLSCAIEYKKALESGDPEAYESRLPIHQDGSCNGLQHYAALGGDLYGARRVNLSSEYDRPQDVYSVVCDRVKQIIERDIASQPKTKGVININKSLKQVEFNKSEVQHYLAVLLGADRIDRKVVKQTVMTTVYGVTMMGAKDQVANRLKEKYFPHTYDMNQINLLARYVAPKIFQAIDDTFTSARNIQSWLTESSKEITRSIDRAYIEKHRQLQTHFKLTHKTQTGIELELNKEAASKTLKKTLAYSSALAWTTPLGLTVVQPYRLSKGRVVSTAMQSFTLKDLDSSGAVDLVRQVAGFPPNFVHSLDATHMLMTALECSKQKLTFASVHDSYWTHAQDVDKLRQILKEQFVKLHSQPILSNLRKEMIARARERKVRRTYTREEYLAKHPEMADKINNVKNVHVWEDVSIKPVPPKGTFDIEQVLQSQYFFN